MNHFSPEKPVRYDSRMRHFALLRITQCLSRALLFILES